MKQFFRLFSLAMLAAVMGMVCSCSGDRMKTTDNGLSYKFIEKNDGAQQVKVGDLIIGVCTIRLEDSVLTKIIEPDRLYPAVSNPSFPGDLNEGLLMMHIGDKAIFGIEADSLANRGMRFPKYYKPGTGMKLYYEIAITDIVTKAEFDEERSNYYENMQQMLQEEASQIEEYVKTNKIKATADEEGLYVVVNKKGHGPKVEIGRDVAINYTGRLLDGKVFDTSLEPIAKSNNIFDEHRKYGPLTYKVGEKPLIRGWEKGVINQPAGSKLTIIMPSALGYGPREVGIIPANSPLVFDIEIVSVN